MTELTFSPAEVGNSCSGAELEQLLSRRAARLRAAELQELTADLTTLRAEQRSREAQAAAAAVVFASAEPSSPDDVLIVVSPASGLQLGPVALSANYEGHWLTPEQTAAMLADRASWSKRYRRELHTRELLVCSSGLPDLRATLAAGFADDALHGARRPYETTSDGARIDELVDSIVRQTHDLATLRAWLEAAGAQPHAAVLRDRIESLVARGLDFGGRR